MILIIAEKNIAGERIANILGSGKASPQSKGRARYYSFEKDGAEHVVVPLRGHVVNVNFPKKYSYWKGTDLKELISAPIDYNQSEPEIAFLLKETGKKVEKVVIATDADREGESIGVEALRILQEANPNVKAERAYFSSMTPKELIESFSSLTNVDYPLSDSADARREIDLIWGAVLTRFVSLMSNRMGKDFISVGRVQTPVLAVIVNREKERNAFVAKPFWELIASCEKEKKKFDASHKKGKIWEEKEAVLLFEKVRDAKEGIVKKTGRKQRTIAKPSPFDTTQFLRSAAVLGLTAGQAMNIAESLYMSGYISYPRTDNTTYPSSLDLRSLLENLTSEKNYSKFVEKIIQKPLNPSRGKKDSKDHPPIHPTKVPPKSIGGREWKVFDLIARRFLATFLEDAKTENASVEIDISGEPFAATGQTIILQGWKEAYPFSVLKENILPKMEEGDKVNVEKITLPKKETTPPARYSQSSLLKIMEENGLGTKSTRHTIIQKLYARKYISGLKSVEPNQIAFAVIDSLEKHCEIVTKPDMTSSLEKEMDEVAGGTKKKETVVDDSRALLGRVLEKLLENKMSISTGLKKALLHQDVMAICPADGGNLVIRKGRTGKRFLGCSNYPNCTTTYPLPQKGSLSSTDKICGQCKSPIIKLSGKRYKMEICVNMDCPTKDEWKKRQAEKAVQTKK
jgi:DNA topoisomerase-1